MVKMGESLDVSLVFLHFILFGDELVTRLMLLPVSKTNPAKFIATTFSSACHMIASFILLNIPIAFRTGLGIIFNPKKCRAFLLTFDLPIFKLLAKRRQVIAIHTVETSAMVAGRTDDISSSV
jgi:hypothetical protein